MVAEKIFGVCILQKTIISITTLPSRLNHIKPCIDSLKRQNIPIYLWIPKYVKRLKEGFDYKLPKYLDGVYIKIVDDLGSLTKLVPALGVAENIITADDDVIYPDWWASRLIDAYNMGDGAYCYRGKILEKGLSYNDTECLKNNSGKINFITGTWGAIYNRNFFKGEKFNYSTTDDVVISYILKKNDIPIHIIPSNYEIKPYSAYSINALWDKNKLGENDVEIEDYFWNEEL